MDSYLAGPFAMSCSGSQKCNFLMECQMTPRREPLTTLPRAIAERTGGVTRSYFILWQAATGARFPAERSDTGRWSYDPRDVPKIMEALGIRPTGGSRADAA